MDFKSDTAIPDLTTFLGDILRPFALVTAFSLQVAGAETPASTVDVPGQREQWSSFLPLMPEMVADQGRELPLPFGVSGIYKHIERDIEISGLRVGPAGSKPQTAIPFVDVGSSSELNIAMERFDVWILPFLNLYGLAGNVDNHTVTRGTVIVPGPTVQTFNFKGSNDLNTFIGGLGLTLAGGYKDFFMMADVNWSQADLGFDDEFRAVTASARAGWNSKIGDVPVRFWGGVTYWDTGNTAKGTVEVPGRGLIQFEADQGPANPWNTSVGVAVSLSKHWEWFGEYGFNLDDVRIVTTGVTFRF